MVHERSSSPSTSSNKSSSAFPSNENQVKATKVSSFCVPKGKWYDFVRPTQYPYRGFGGMYNFDTATSDAAKDVTGDLWSNDLHHTMEQNMKGKSRENSK